jgi:hypothetical protein
VSDGSLDFIRDTVNFLCNDIARDNRFMEYRMKGVDFNAYLDSSFNMAYYDILS